MFSETDYDKLQQIMTESPEKKELLERLLASHKTTISTISHEIRNPLTLVSGTLQLIQSQHPEVQTFKHWDSLMNDVAYMTSLLNELSSYDNSSRLTIESVSLCDYLKTIALSFAASVVDTDIEFTSQIDSALPVISADSLKLKEVILNLLTNAKDSVLIQDAVLKQESMLKQKSGISFHPQISLRAYIEDHNIFIRIQDNGPGISPEQLPHIFEPFVTYKKTGTGLGLAIASQIIQAHGGTIEVSSVPGNVTSFTVTLPIQ